MDQNLCFEYQQLMSRYNNIQLELKKNDSQHQRQQIKKEKLSKELKNNKTNKNNKNNNLKVEDMPTHVHEMPTHVHEMPTHVHEMPTHVHEMPTMPTQQHHILNFSKLFKKIKPAPVVVPAEEAVVVPAEEAVVVPAAPIAQVAMKNIILFKALQKTMFKRQ